MNRKKGFTLIELLAVIIILAIIALIATPIIMRVIENSKKGTAERSAENYLHQVETQAMAQRTEGTILDGTYGINSNGNLCPNNAASCGENEIKIEMNGTKPSSGSITVSSTGKVQSTGTRIVIGDYTATINESGSATAKKYTQKFKPQYYSWMSGSIGDNLPSDKTFIPAFDYDFYLGLDSEDGETVSVAYACFVRNGNEYCLNVNDEDAYGGSKDVIREAFADVVDTNSCRFDRGFYGYYLSSCSADGLSALAFSFGSVQTSAGNSYCHVGSDGIFTCSE